jgi:hypothetical protein
MYSTYVANTDLWGPCTVHECIANTDLWCPGGRHITITRRLDTVALACKPTSPQAWLRPRHVRPGYKHWHGSTSFVSAWFPDMEVAGCTHMDAAGGWMCQGFLPYRQAVLQSSRCMRIAVGSGGYPEWYERSRSLSEIKLFLKGISFSFCLVLVPIWLFLHFPMAHVTFYIILFLFLMCARGFCPAGND